MMYACIDSRRQRVTLLDQIQRASEDNIFLMSAVPGSRGRWKALIRPSRILSGVGHALNKPQVSRGRDSGVFLENLSPCCLPVQSIICRIQPHLTTRCIFISGISQLIDLIFFPYYPLPFVEGSTALNGQSDTDTCDSLLYNTKEHQTFLWNIKRRI